MSNDKMREAFEAEFRKHHKFEGNAMYVGAMLERGSDGNYRFTIAESAWWGWQASRESLVIELPEPHEEYHPFVGDLERPPLVFCAYNIRAILTEIGLKVTP